MTYNRLYKRTQPSRRSFLAIVAATGAASLGPRALEGGATAAIALLEAPRQ